MKKTFITATMAFVFCCLTTSVAAKSSMPGDTHDYAFQQERMLIVDDEIYIVSNFKGEDHVTKYDFYGQRHWDAPFFAKILAWDIRKQGIIVFAKKRNGLSTYLTLLDPATGKMIWQRP